MHLTLFLLLAATARWRFGPQCTVLSAVLAYAVVSEVVQWLGLAERSGDLLDVVADTVGALLGWALAARRLAGRRPVAG